MRVACLKPKLILAILSYVVLRLLILELLIVDLLG